MDEETHAPERPGGAGEAPPEMGRSTPVTTAWVAVSLAVFVAESVLSGTGILAPENLGLPAESGLFGEAIRRCLERGNPLVLPVASLLHRGLVHLFLGCVALIGTAKVIERARGSGFALVTVILTGAIGAAAGWIAGGDPAIGLSACYFGFLGVMGAFAVRNVIPRRLAWFGSFPLIVLAAVFTYLAEHAPYMSHAGHLSAAAAGATLGAVVGEDRPFRLPIRIALLGWLAAAALFTLGSAVREGDWEFRWEGLRPGGILSGSRFETYRDPGGRFRISYPASLEPTPLGPDGRDIAFRTTGIWGEGDVLRIEVRARSPFLNLESLAQNRFLSLREEIQEAEGWDSIVETSEQEERAGPTEARRLTGTIRGGRGELRYLLLFAITEDRMYWIESFHDSRDDTTRKWATRMVDSLEILR